MKICAQFRFNQAGQGSFYTGLFHRPGYSEAFSIVYDCGADTKNKKSLIEEICSFWCELKSKCDETLDLLVISHFDADHVNHILFLLRRLKACRRVVLPYLLPAERLLLYVATIYENEDLADQDYLRFLIDPLDYLRSYDNVGEVIFISGDESNSVLFLERAPLSPDGQFSDELITADDSEMKANLITDAYREIHSHRNPQKAFVCRNDVRFYVQPEWEFYFHHKRSNSPALINEFSKRISAEFPEVNPESPTVDCLMILLANKARVKKIYTDIFDEVNLNPTSLIVWHGSSKPHKMFRLRIDRPSFFSERNRFVKMLPTRTGTLLTGDIYLNEIDWPWYIKSKFSITSIIQIPHHGSATGWQLDKIIEAEENWPGWWVINFGLGNRWRHPRGEVISDLLTTIWDIRLVHELEPFAYHFIG